jgi:hypothetical protein
VSSGFGPPFGPDNPPFEWDGNTPNPVDPSLTRLAEGLETFFRNGMSVAALQSQLIGLSPEDLPTTPVTEIQELP